MFERLLGSQGQPTQSFDCCYRALFFTLRRTVLSLRGGIHKRSQQSAIWTRSRCPLQERIQIIPIMELLNNLSVFKRNRRNMYAFDLYSIFGTVHFGNQSLGGVSYWNNFTCSALAQSREQRWRIGMLLRDTQKGPLISQRPFALIGSKNCSGET